MTTRTIKKSFSSENIFSQQKTIKGTGSEIITAVEVKKETKKPTQQSKPKRSTFMCMLRVFLISFYIIALTLLLFVLGFVMFNVVFSKK